MTARRRGGGGGGGGGGDGRDDFVKVNRGGSGTLPSAAYEPRPWQPSLRVAFMGLLAVRVFAALAVPIADCDETFNYWEPTHYLAFGRGMQTWEYSPVFALRSYAYLLPFAAVSRLVAFFAAETFTIFYYVRVLLAALSAGGDALLYAGLCRTFRQPLVPQFALAFLLITTGPFLAATAFVPSAFAMYFISAAYGCWMMGRVGWAVFLTAFAGIMGWPFCLIVALPMALHLLATAPLLSLVGSGVVSLAVIVLPMIAIDEHYYGKVVFAVLNLFIYNTVGGSGGDSELYGVEPWDYYFRNLFLNFNFALPLALLAPLTLVVPAWRRSLYRGRGAVMGVILAGAGLWMAFLTWLPHKEERFMYVIYPLLCVAAAATAAGLLAALSWIWDSVPCLGKLRSGRDISWLAGALLFVVVGALALSRTVGQAVYYGAPLGVYEDLYTSELIGRVGERVATGSPPILVCVGKEWYRFATSFFFPSADVELGFYKDGFDGLLPQPFAPVNGTRVLPPHMNDQNREEPSRYVDPSTCDYIVDLDEPNQAGPHFAEDTANWEVVASRRFLDAAQSPTLTRAFYIPFLSERNNVYNNYVALRNRHR